MTQRGLLLVGLSALLTALANLLLRGGVLRFGEFSLSLGSLRRQLLALGTEPLFVSGVILYGLAALVWFSVVSFEDLSGSYPVLVGLTFVLVAAGAVVFFQEQMPLQKVAGMLTILAGVVLVAKA